MKNEATKARRKGTLTHTHPLGGEALPYIYSRWHIRAAYGCICWPAATKPFSPANGRGPKRPFHFLVRILHYECRKWPRFYLPLINPRRAKRLSGKSFTDTLHLVARNEIIIIMITNRVKVNIFKEFIIVNLETC